MKLLGLHGLAGAGKDSFADRLVARHGFVKRGFADPLYEEVAAAFNVSVPWLRDRARKETPQDLLRVVRCNDRAFAEFISARGDKLLDMRSPRWVLEQWGTDYRRQHGGRDSYCLDQMADYANKAYFAGERGLVIPDCRFANEANWIRGAGGHVARIVRPGIPIVSGHLSALPLPSELVDSTISNSAGLFYLYTIADFALYSGIATGRAA